MKNHYGFLLTVMLVLSFFSGLSVQADPDIEATILYDNYVHTPGTQSDWGFACLIKGMEQTILFDTGTKGSILLHNMRVLSVSASGIDIIIISHNHGDHIGGLLPILELNADIDVFLPPSISPDMVERIKQKTRRVEIVTQPRRILPDVFLTGPLGTDIIEQSLILIAGSGGVLITGCSHPGIVDIVARAGEIIKTDIHTVFGGFHLMQHSQAQLQEIAARFEKMNVRQVGATHCSGENTIRYFKTVYQDHFLGLGVGKKLTFAHE